MALDPNLLALVLLYRACFGAGDKIARGPFRDLNCLLSLGLGIQYEVGARTSSC